MGWLIGQIYPAQAISHIHAFALNQLPKERRLSAITPYYAPEQIDENTHTPRFLLLISCANQLASGLCRRQFFTHSSPLSQANLNKPGEINTCFVVVIKNKNPRKMLILSILRGLCVPGAGVEPARACGPQDFRTNYSFRCSLPIAAICGLDFLFTIHAKCVIRCRLLSLYTFQEFPQGLARDCQSVSNLIRFPRI